jgi:integrase
MANRAVSIYECTKKNGKQGWARVEIPAKKPDGKLYLKNNLRADFYISWYEGLDEKGRPKKKWKKVAALRANELPYLDRAVAACEAKQWELQHPERVKQESLANGQRLSISAAIFQYLENFVGTKSTIKEHRNALKEFEGWTSCNYVEDITRAMLLRWKEVLVKGGNDELTAVWKIIRVNKFYKSVMGLAHGAGLVKTTEFKSILRRKPRIHVYGAKELARFFAACDERQLVLFQLYYKCGLRNKELAHLEWSDLDLEQRIVSIHAKKALKNGDERKQWVPKHGSEGEVPVPECVVEPLKKMKESANGCNLVFPTRNCRVNIKLLDQCKLVAKRAGFANWEHWKIKSFRSTYATNRLRNGYDLATLREQLRHKDSKSIEHYLDFVKNEQLIDSGKVDSGWDA